MHAGARVHDTADVPVILGTLLVTAVFRPVTWLPQHAPCKRLVTKTCSFADSVLAVGPCGPTL